MLVNVDAADASSRQGEKVKKRLTQTTRKTLLPNKGRAFVGALPVECRAPPPPEPGSERVALHYLEERLATVKSIRLQTPKPLVA